jgi:hypothetical protein
MKGSQSAICAFTLLAFTACLAAGPAVYYDGRECDGNGSHDYTYILVAGKGVPIKELCVGTTDLDEHHYSDVLVPEGWSFAIEEGGPGHAGGRCTAIGDISPGPVRSKSIGQVRWWVEKPELAVESFTFGFNHPWYAEDVGWRSQTEKDIFVEDWVAPLGEGAGPVHGPYSSLPEPVTLSLLAVGGLALLRRKGYGG